MRYRLSKHQIEQFKRDGFISFKLDLDDRYLDKIVQTLGPCYESDDSPGFFRHGTRIENAWYGHRPVRLLATNSQILNVLYQLFGRKPLPFQTLNFPVGTEQRAHSDTIHFNSEPGGYLAGVWVALEDVDSANGPLVYYPSSHKLPEYNMQQSGVGIGYENYAGYEKFIARKIREQNLEPSYGVLSKGSAFIWHGNLLHGGAPQKDKDRTRHSQVTHYYFEGCRYYAPMKSTPDSTVFHNPPFVSTRAALSRRLKKKLKEILFH